MLSYQAPPVRRNIPSAERFIAILTLVDDSIDAALASEMYRLGYRDPAKAYEAILHSRRWNSHLNPIDVVEWVEESA